MFSHNIKEMLSRHFPSDSIGSDSDSDGKDDEAERENQMDGVLSTAGFGGTSGRAIIDPYEQFAKYKEAFNRSNSSKASDDAPVPTPPNKYTLESDLGLSTIAQRIHSINLEPIKTPAVSHLQQTHQQPPLSQSPFYQKIIREEQERAEKTERLRLEEIAKAAKKDSFPELSDTVQNIVDKAFGNGPNIVVQGFKVDLTRDDIRTLRPGTWLNDEVINFYGQLLMERAERNPGGQYPKIHFFNTFFYTTLSTHGYARIRRWTKKFDLFALDLCIIPVHLGMHWCCSVINFRDKRIEYYDSLHGRKDELFKIYRDYLNSESMDKKKVPFDFTGWADFCPRDIPGQLNGFDCGVFTCMYAEYRSREAEFDFSQKQMPYIRRRMVYEILQKRLQFDE
ncbi:UNVERIFIED_CONTAM: SUMO1 sentrin specific peptidase 1 [Siphonaria sp. JEL0065]|nr:SUMO1 sentrin specific peptidase 1 [Siphonaria sp. JEL0065]